ncbi:MAG: hypothetical protein QG622_1972 [Actinomycetota bacterium]|nr:hypothetical protein [Actinomycetota bacterium]
MPRRVGRPLITAVTVALLGVPVLVPSATASPFPGSRADRGVPEAGLVLASDAVAAVGGVASTVLAERVERALIAVGGAAVTVKLPGPRRAAVPKAAGPTWRWNGWVSGAAGPETDDGTFAAFRGEPLGIVGVWSDTSAESQTSMGTLKAYDDYVGEIDIAVGGLVRGETWAQAAAGRFVGRWTTAVRTIKAHRAGKGTTYIRIAHEMNGDWMAWGVTSKNLAAFKKGYRLYASIIRKEFHEARITFSPNSGNHTDVSIDKLWPGDDITDVIGPDYYDWDNDVASPASWKQETNAWLVPKVTPTGLAAWREYAERRGKPIAMPEWGLPMGDDPQWITYVHDYMARYAAGRGSTNVAGRFVYDVYFNAEPKFKLLGGDNPRAGAAYAKLTWGK